MTLEELKKLVDENNEEISFNINDILYDQRLFLFVTRKQMQENKTINGSLVFADNGIMLKCLDILISGFSEFLKTIRSKNNKTAVLLEDPERDIFIAAVVEYNKNSWEYYWTFDKDDITNTEIYKLTNKYFDVRMSGFFNKHAFRHGVDICDMNGFVKQNFIILQSINEYIDYYAKENEIFIIYYSDHFAINVKKSNHKIIKNILLSKELKAIVESD